MSTELVINPRIAQWTVEAFTRLLATYAIVLGVIVLTASDARFAAEQYASTLQLPGFPTAWGAMLLIFGAVALVGSLARSPRMVEAGSFAAAVWEIFFAVSILKVVVMSPNASPTAAAVHTFVAVAFVLSAITYRQSRRS